MPRRARFMTPAEAARLLGISASGIRWLIDVRRLRATRTLSGRRLVSARDLEELRQTREQAARRRRGVASWAARP